MPLESTFLKFTLRGKSSFPHRHGPYSANTVVLNTKRLVRKKRRVTTTSTMAATKFCQHCWGYGKVARSFTTTWKFVEEIQFQFR